MSPRRETLFTSYHMTVTGVVHKHHILEEGSTKGAIGRLQRLVGRCDKVRAVGNATMDTKLFDTTGEVIQLNRLRLVRTKANRVICQAGVTGADLIIYFKNLGRSLPVKQGASSRTVGGVISTGDLGLFGISHRDVLSVTWVDHAGTKHTRKLSTELYGMLGCYGVIVEVSFKLSGFKHVPWIKPVLAEIFHSIPKNCNLRYSPCDTVGVLLPNIGLCVSGGVRNLVIGVIQQIPFLLLGLCARWRVIRNSFLVRVIRTINYTIAVQGMLNYATPPQYCIGATTRWIVSAKYIGRVMKEIRRNTKPEWAAEGYIDVWWQTKDTGMINPSSRFTKAYSLSCTLWSSNVNHPLLRMISSVMLRNESLPCWNRVHGVNYISVQNMYPGIDAFREQLRRVDPKHKFYSPYMYCLFGRVGLADQVAAIATVAGSAVSGNVTGAGTEHHPTDQRLYADSVAGHSAHKKRPQKYTNATRPSDEFLRSLADKKNIDPATKKRIENIIKNNNSTATQPSPPRTTASALAQARAQALAPARAQARAPATAPTERVEMMKVMESMISKTPAVSPSE